MRNGEEISEIKLDLSIISGIVNGDIDTKALARYTKPPITFRTPPHHPYHPDYLPDHGPDHSVPPNDSERYEAPEVIEGVPEYFGNLTETQVNTIIANNYSDKKQYFFYFNPIKARVILCVFQNRNKTEEAIEKSGRSFILAGMSAYSLADVISEVKGKKTPVEGGIDISPPAEAIIHPNF